ncbi:hypothetical protein BV20DRAFT_836391 [Pilatotrama ljubarskyi]|nr:hypothetical protein BV20DRAFT_836391 [Pilatotrama ljubarskyi]
MLACTPNSECRGRRLRRIQERRNRFISLARGCPKPFMIVLPPAACQERPRNSAARTLCTSVAKRVSLPPLRVRISDPPSDDLRPPKSSQQEYPWPPGMRVSGRMNYGNTICPELSLPRRRSPALRRKIILQLSFARDSSSPLVSTRTLFADQKPRFFPTHVPLLSQPTECGCDRTVAGYGTSVNDPMHRPSDPYTLPLIQLLVRMHRAPTPPAGGGPAKWKVIESIQLLGHEFHNTDRHQETIPSDRTVPQVLIHSSTT